MTVMAKTNKVKSGTFSKKQKKKQNLNKSGKVFKHPDKRGRLIVRNLPFQTNEEELQKHFENFGSIKEIHLLRRPNNKLVGCGFVEFSSRQHAEKAIEELNGKLFLGRPIYVEKAVSRDRYNEPSIEEDEKVDNKTSEDEEIKTEPIHDDGDDVVFNSPEIKKEELSSDGESGSDSDSSSDEERNSNLNQKSKNLRKGRLIVRNLSFKSTEEKVKDHFAQFGEITEVKLLRKPNKSLVGCGFVQFSKKSSAAKAIHHTSGKPFLGRPIIVDWALAKDKFKKMQEEAVKKEIKKEELSDEESKPIDISNSLVKKEESDESDDGHKKDSSDSEEEEEDDDGSDSDEEDDEMDESGDHEKGVKQSLKQEYDKSKKNIVDDVDEGKTVFVKNLPFSVENDEFKTCMEQFGPVQYALICKDKLTEHSRGSGFVKFKNKEDAEKCLSSGTELTLKGNILDPHPALKRDDAQQLKDKKDKGKKDNRNLYLVREGLIIAGTPAARGVSVSDMERRLQLEQWKNNKLRNLNMFVSQNRLVIHNLPENFSDKQLRKLFLKHTESNANITEARIMRDLKRLDSKGIGVSKGYGFVSFEKHEDALKALRSINNNPTVFSPSSRPIVAFSIENKSVINTKRKRMVRSQQKNPLCKNFKHEEDEPDIKKKKLGANINKDIQDEPDYAGIAAKPGSAVKMRQKYKLKNQAQQHIQDVRKEKREMKMSRKIRRTEHIKQKQGEKKARKRTSNATGNDIALTKLIDKYKTKLMTQASNKKKWYD